jgi:hypothetical protein
VSWDAALHGRIRVPQDQREAWLDSSLEWEAVAGHDLWRGDRGGATVREVLDKLPMTSEIQFLEASWAGDELQIRGFVDKDMFLDTRIGIGSVFAAAARFGGRGQLIGMGMMTASFGYRLRVADGSATLEQVPDGEVSALDEQPDAIAIEERVMLAIADLE